MFTSIFNELRKYNLVVGMCLCKMRKPPLFWGCFSCNSWLLVWWCVLFIYLILKSFRFVLQSVVMYPVIFTVGRLVTVKFLTLKRYHQRFPSAIHAEEHLKPSGTSNSTIPRFESAPVNESDSDSDSWINVLYFCMDCCSWNTEDTSVSQGTESYHFTTGEDCV